MNRTPVRPGGPSWNGFHPFCRRFADYLKWRLKGDNTAGTNFVGGDCGLCRSAQWKVQQKNLTPDPGTTPEPTTPQPTTPSGITLSCTAA